MSFKKEIEKCLFHLKDGNVILYPTDTVWGIGCDATNEKAVTKVYDIKNREASKSLILLVSSYAMLLKYIETIPVEIKKTLSKTSYPTTVIYNNPNGIAKNAIAKDNTIAIRIVRNGFAYQLIREFGKPIVSTSANISGEKTPKKFTEIARKLIEKVTYTVVYKKELPKSTSSKIIRFKNNKIITLRA